jgi:hypothetical protein
MRSILISAVIVVTAMISSHVALAAVTVQVPEPVSMSLLAGGIVAIAAIKRLHRK